MRARGVDPLTATISAAQKAQIAEFINERVKEGWERAFWPEVMLSEQRQYRPTWDSVENYATGDEVYHEDAAGNEKYWVSLQDGNIAKDPDTESAWWREAGADFLRTISFQQQGETEIGAVDCRNCVFTKDPRVNRFAGRIEQVILYEDGILINSDTAPARPWIWFRPPPPEYSLTDWSGATAYAIGDLVYYAASGESYKALKPSTNKNPYSETEDWRPVDFPAFLRTYVKYGAHAEYLLDPVERATAEARAEMELQSLEERIVDQQEGRKAVFRR